MLNDGDLKELGFAMGPRKQLLSWIRSQTHNVAVQDSGSAAADVSVPSTSATPAASQAPKFKVCVLFN